MTHPLRSNLAWPFLFFLLVVFRVEALTPPPLPSIDTNNIFNVTNSTYGAVPDGVTDDTAAIQAAIGDATVATAGVGGGTVELPGPGTYLCGPLTMRSQVNLQVDSGATLEMLPQSSWPSSSTPFILGSSVHDVEMSGSGTIYGQGSGWWGMGSRPNFIQFTSTKNILFANLTLSNPPTFHLMLKNNNSNITMQGLNINTSPTSPNTDGMDVGSTNMLIENCYISDGDDNIELGGSSATAAYITITNCTFGHGHGVSVGSDIGAGVHDVTVINCTFNNTDNGIRLKSDSNRGGLVQNMFYYNIGMTNITYAPILIYSYYNTFGNPSQSGITPAFAQATNAASVTGTEPIWRNIIISNLTATGSQPGMIWARTEAPATNIILSELNITSTDSRTGDGSFALYNVKGAQILDSQIHTAGSSKSFEMFNAQATFSNSVPGAGTITLTGVSVTNALAFYNQSASLSDGTIFGATGFSLGGSTISDGTGLTLSSAVPVNFALGTNTTQVAVSGNLTLNSTLNITNGAGFTYGTYPLFTYTGSLSGTPILGTTPTTGSYTYSLNTGTAGQVNLVVTPPPSPVIGNIQISGTNLVFNGTGGVTNGTFYLLGSTNLALPLSQWTRLSTNTFNASGHLSLTNSFGTNTQSYYSIQLQ